MSDLCSAPGAHPVGTGADQVAGAVEPCLDARSAPADGDGQIPAVQQQQRSQCHQHLRRFSGSHN